MAITQVQQVLNSTTDQNSTTVTLTVPTGITTTVGNHLIMMIGHSNATSSFLASVSDSKGNTWQIDIDQNDGGTTGAWASLASTHLSTALVAGDTITLTYMAAPGTYEVFLVYEYSGLASSSWVDTAGGTGGGKSTSFASPSITTTNANDLLLGVLCYSGTGAYTETGSGFSNVITQQSSPAHITLAVNDRTVSATGTYNDSGTTSPSAYYSFIIGAYKAASGGVTHSDSGSGTITLSASIAEALTRSESGSGTITLSGSRAEALIRSESGSGTITLSGSATEAHGSGYTDAASGSITLSGSGPDAWEHTDIVSGTILFGGSGADGWDHSDSVSGTILLGGSGSDLYQPPGGAFNDAGSGTITFTGSGAVSYSHGDLGSGTITLSGSETNNEVHGYQDSASGTISLSGSRTEGISFTWSPTATLFLTGSDFDSYIGGQIALAIALLLGDHGPLMNLNWRMVTATLDNSYPSGGYALIPAELGFTTIRVLLPIPYGGYVFQWTGSRLMAFQQSGAAGPMIEVPNGTNLSAESLDLFIIGDHI